MKKKFERTIILIAHNLRSCHNVGSLLRTAEGLGVSKVYLTGYSPYPTQINDDRLPHIYSKITAQITKTSLGAEKYTEWEHCEDVIKLICELKSSGHQIVGLEQTDHSIDIDKFKPKDKAVLVIGREVEGVEKEVLDECDSLIEIPMRGKKESFNVVQAAAMALYHFTRIS